MADSALTKLRYDKERFLQDYNLSLALQLIFVVDFWPVFYFRVREHLGNKKGLLAKVSRKVLTILKPLVEGFSGCRIEHGATIGKGLLLHYSVGIAITSQAIIGENCTLFTQACIVHKANKKGQGAATIGNNVELGSGCKIVGNVRIGDGVAVGANSVVLNDVPDNCIAVGIPARYHSKADK